MPEMPYQRVLLKLSGEALQGNQAFGIDPTMLANLAKDLLSITQLGVQLGIVIGGGNLFRGAALSNIGISRVTGDQMGMLATVMNALALRDALEHLHCPVRLLSAMPIRGIADNFDYNPRIAIRHLNKGRIVIFAGGTGNPLVTTDSAASLRAIEVNANLLLKASHVDGIYSADPKQDSTAVRYQRLTYREALERELGVMDLSAFSQCRDHNITLRVFDITKPGALLRAVQGADEGTLVVKE